MKVGDTVRAIRDVELSPSAIVGNRWRRIEGAEVRHIEEGDVGVVKAVSLHKPEAMVYFWRHGAMFDCWVRDHPNAEVEVIDADG